MGGLGTYLGQLREERGLSIDEVARVTRVAPRYLEALEREDFAALPAPVFTRGYIRAYCQALEVPADEALSRFVDTAGPAGAAPAAIVVPTVTRSSDDGRRRSQGTLVASFVLLVGFGAALVVVALLLQSGRPDVGARHAAAPAPPVDAKSEPVTGSAPLSAAPAAPATEATSPTSPPAVAQPPVSAPPAAAPAVSPPVAAAPAPKASPAPPSASPITGGSPANTSSPSARSSDSRADVPAAARRPAEAAAPLVAEHPPLRLGGVVSPYRLVARTSEATWLRVRTEDGRATDEMIPAGEVREWISNRPFVVTIGNAGGIALELNGQKLPPLGGPGAVIMRMVLPPGEP